MRGVSPIRAVVFDLDGTLIDSRGDIAAACNHALAAHGLATLATLAVASLVGDGARLLMARAAGLAPDDARVEPLLAAFVDFYSAHPARHTRLLPGAEALLAELSQLRLGLCTNKPRRTTDAVLAALDLERHFDAVVAGGDTQEQKPNPAPLLRLIDGFGVRPEEVAMVGDGAQDVDCGRAAGAYTIGVEGPFGTERLDPAQPDARVRSLGEVSELFRSLWAPASCVSD